jgi:hypothetical protein
VAPPLVTGDDGFFGPTVVPGAVSVAPPLVTGDDGLFGPTVLVVINIAPPLVTGDDGFFGPDVFLPPQEVDPPLVTGDDGFFAPTITRMAKGALLISGMQDNLGSLLSIANNGAIFGQQTPGALVDMTRSRGEVIGKLPLGKVLEIS